MGARPLAALLRRAGPCVSQDPGLVSVYALVNGAWEMGTVVQISVQVYPLTAFYRYTEPGTGVNARNGKEPLRVVGIGSLTRVSPGLLHFSFSSQLASTPSQSATFSASSSASEMVISARKVVPEEHCIPRLWCSTPSPNGQDQTTAREPTP